LAFLAGKAGVELKPQKPGRKKVSWIGRALAADAAIYSLPPEQGPEAAIARNYLERRG
jgi:hypothetical protein